MIEYIHLLMRVFLYLFVTKLHGGNNQYYYRFKRYIFHLKVEIKSYVFRQSYDFIRMVLYIFPHQYKSLFTNIFIFDKKYIMLWQPDVEFYRTRYYKHFIMRT